MPRQYLFTVDFSMEDLDIWNYPDELSCVDVEEIPTFTRFKMNPSITLEINEDEFLDQVNCGQTVIKNTMFSLNDDQVKSNVDAKILVSKLQTPCKEVTVGLYNLPHLHSSFQQLMDQFDSHTASQPEDLKCGPHSIQPCSEIKRELVQLVNLKGQPIGSLHYSLRLTCFGPSISQQPMSEASSIVDCRKKQAENLCLDRGAKPCPCPSDSQVKDRDFDEYSAEVNGNQLIVRIHKRDSHLVTRVFDSNMDLCGNEKEREKNLVSICGCDQQIDFKFPKNFSCGDCKAKSKKCDCGPESMLTDFQRQTSCIGKSFKNSCCLPVIRGNLKYPGRINDGSINFDLFGKCNPRDATEKYKKKPPTSRCAGLQVDEQNLKQELNGNCKIPRGIEICKKGCSDPDTDVFILKIGSRKSDKKGRKNEIELEMRTPKGPDNEIKKKETREIQVNEKDFEETKKEKDVDSKKKATDDAPSKGKPSSSKGFVKKRK